MRGVRKRWCGHKKYDDAWLATAPISANDEHACEIECKKKLEQKDNENRLNAFQGKYKMRRQNIIIPNTHKMYV